MKAEGVTVQRALLAIALGALLLANPAEAIPGVDAPARVEVTALRQPLVRTWDAIAAGLDAFEKHHALAPAVPPRMRMRNWC